MKPIHYAYLLRLWQAGTAENPTWRVSLEDPHTRQVIGFDNLEALNEYLQRLRSTTDQSPKIPDPERRTLL